MYAKRKIFSKIYIKIVMKFSLIKKSCLMTTVKFNITISFVFEDEASVWDACE